MPLEVSQDVSRTLYGFGIMTKLKLIKTNTKYPNSSIKQNQISITNNPEYNKNDQIKQTPLYLNTDIFKD